MTPSSFVKVEDKLLKILIINQYTVLNADTCRCKTYPLVVVEAVYILEGGGGELWREAALQPDGDGGPLLQRGVRLGAFIFVLVLIPNLGNNRDARSVTAGTDTAR